MRRIHASSGGAIAVFLLLAALGPVACGGDEVEPVAEEQLAADREMDMALEDPEAEPELRDEPRTKPPAPRPQAAPARRAAPPPPPSAGQPVAEAEPQPIPQPLSWPQRKRLSAPAGTSFRVELTEELSTRTNRVGDQFLVRLLDPITDGWVVVAPAETIIRGEITALQKSGGGGEPAVIKVTFEDVFVGGEYFPLRASVTEANPKMKSRSGTGEKAAKIGGGAVAGAILGRVVGGNAKGAVIGAAVGAAAGTAITLVTEDKDAVLPQGSQMTLRLDEELVVWIVE